MESIHDLIKNRRTVHNYKQQSVERSLVDKALELGLYALNHKHTRPWFFTLLGAEARLKFAELALAEKKKAKPNMTEAMLEKVKEKYIFPAELIVLGCKKVDDSFQQKEDYASVACAVQNISLYLWSKGVGSKWSTGAVTRSDELYQLGEVDKNEQEIVGVLWVGVPADGEIPLPPKGRLEEHFKEIK